MIEHLRVLVSESSSASADSVVSALLKVGFVMPHIHIVKSYKAAVKHIEDQSVDFLITEYQIEGRSGLELIALLSDKNPHKLSMLVTHNNATSAIAEAAEELVDDYLIKPFLSSHLENRIRSLVQKRISPSKYLEEIRKGKQYLIEEHYQAAQMQFKNALNLHEQPTLAYYYLGHSHFKEKKFEDALQGFKEGLTLRPLHFRCLAGQFDTYFEQRRYEEAFDLAALLTTHYPIGAKRLCHLFVAAVYAKKMEEVPRYFDLFSKLHHVTPELRRTFSGALLVAGMFHLNKRELEKALYCFECGLQVIGPDLHYIQKVVKSLVALGPESVAAADGFLRRLPSRLVGGQEHSVLLYLVNQFRQSSAETISQGRQLVQKKYADLDCYKVLIRSLLAEQRQQMAEDYFYRGVALYPELKDEFAVIFN